MNTRLIIRLTAPVVAVSLLLLALGVGTAWYVQRWQKSITYDLLVNVSGVRAAEELEILVREARTRLDHFLITGNRQYLAEVPNLRAETDHWLDEAERWGDTRREEQLIARARAGNRRFWNELERITVRTPDAELTTQVRGLIDNILVQEILEPTHEYLDVNELQVEQSIANHQSFAERLVYILLGVGTCGSAAGLLAGFALARGLSRSLVQLSVLIRDAAGHLKAGIEPITFSGGGLGELEKVLQVISERVVVIVERLQEKDREVIRAGQLAAVGQLAAGMAHELRNPLTSMKIIVQGALNRMSADAPGVDPDIGSGLSGRDLTVLDDEITRLERLSQSFLDFAGPPKPDKKVLDVRPLVEQTIAFIAPRAALKRIELVSLIRPVSAALDAGQFRQVLLNLLLNALDATPDGGTISVRLASDENGWLTLEVTDEGCGLPAALGERIFEPFTTTKDTGLGLGLSICKRIAEAHGGMLTGANRKAGGAVFTLRVPMAEVTDSCSTISGRCHDGPAASGR